MDYLKLLFAVEVRKLAVKIAYMAHDDLEEELDGDPDKDAKLAEWEAAHTADDFLEEAYLKIEATVEKIEGFEKAQRAKRLENNRFAQMMQRPPASPSRAEKPSE